MMRDDKFREQLQEALGPEPQASDEIRHAVRRRARRRRHSRRALVTTGALVTVVAVISVAIWSRPRDCTKVSVSPTTRAPATTGPATTGPATTLGPGWHTIARPPYSYAVAGVRVAEQAMVAFTQPGGLRFAMFDPATQRWTKLPDPPLDLQAPYTDSPTFANTGDAILVWGHAQATPSDTSTGPMRIMEYLPRAQQWRLLPGSPIRTLIQATPIWTGTELIVWGSDMTGGPNQAAAFDLQHQRWRQLPVGPLHGREDPVVVWTGTEMLVYGGYPLDADPNEGAAFNPATNAWRTLPPSGLTERELGATAWTGKLLIVWSGEGAGNGPPAPGDGAAYNPANNQWRRIAAAPIRGRELAAVAWTGSDLFIWSGQSFQTGRQTIQNGATYNPTTDQWKLLAPAPLVSRWGAVAVWTGKYIVVVEGYGPSRPLQSSEPPLADAAIFRP